MDIRGADAKRMLAAIFCGDYMAEAPEDCIRQMTADDTQRALLVRKIKGKNPIKDADEIRKITGCTEEDAMYFASVYAEVTAYQDFARMVKLAGSVSEEEARELIHQGLSVEKTAKVGIELKPEE